MASRYPASWLDELRSRSDIVQIVSGYVALTKKGRNYWGLCPFHGEKTASFSVDGEHQLYYCFGCKAGGDVIHFIMDMERLSFPEAVEQLADRAHMTLPEMEKDEDYERRRTQRERLLNANREAARFYHETLFTPAGEAALALVWSGDAQYAIDLNPALAYAVPKEGSNIWIDPMVIIKDARNLENAEKFVNFLCRPDIAQRNCEEIWYSSPNAAAIELMGEEYTENPVMNPSEETIASCEFFTDIPEKFLPVYTTLWNEVKNAK